MTYDRLPRPNSVTFESYFRGLLSSLPPGGLDKDSDSLLYKLLRATAVEFYGDVTKAQTMQNKLNPGLTDGEALQDWLNTTVDDKCYDLNSLTDAQKRTLVIESLRGGLPYLTAKAVQDRLNSVFTPHITVTEVYINRFGDRFGTRFSSAPYADIRYSRQGINDATVELIRCFIQSILPIYVVRFVNADTEVIGTWNWIGVQGSFSIPGSADTFGGWTPGNPDRTLLSEGAFVSNTALTGGPIPLADTGSTYRISFSSSPANHLQGGLTAEAGTHSNVASGRVRFWITSLQATREFIALYGGAAQRTILIEKVHVTA